MLTWAAWTRHPSIHTVFNIIRPVLSMYTRLA
jgi:hypothetical protein